MFQYNLKTLLLAMLAVCILTWFFFVLPDEISVVMLMGVLLVIPSAVLAGVLYFRGYPQAFAIGCVPPQLVLGVMTLFEGPPLWRLGPRNSIEVKIVFLVYLLVIVAAGAVSAGVRWLAVWSQQPSIQTKSFPGLASHVGQPTTPDSRPISPDS